LIDELIQKFDQTGVFKVVCNFPDQISEAIENVKDLKIESIKKEKISNVIISGLGGSAIGGDLIRTYLKNKINVPIIVNRDYILPEFVNENTLVLISSYSGNTEETISAYKNAIKKKAMVICITNGGEIKKIAVENNHQAISIPSGYHPRMALGFMFFNLLYIFIKLGFLKEPVNEISELIDSLKRKSKKYSDYKSENNSLKIAKDLKGKFLFIYSSPDLESVGIRWRGQFSENSKVISSTHYFPELNHNEIVAWTQEGGLTNMLKESVIICLRDQDDFIRVKFRIDITKDVMKKYASEILEFQGEGSTFLVRMFDLIYLIDWISYYMAILNNADPAEIQNINYLKNQLSIKKEWE
jgi:glucose/mannose-6-phosphate isomerase